MLTLPDVAHRLRLPWSVAWSLVLRGELRGEKRGGRWYVTTSSVEQFRRRGADTPREAA